MALMMMMISTRLFARLDRFVRDKHDKESVSSSSSSSSSSWVRVRSPKIYKKKNLLP